MIERTSKSMHTIKKYEARQKYRRKWDASTKKNKRRNPEAINIGFVAVITVVPSQGLLIIACKNYADDDLTRRLSGDRAVCIQPAQ
jgi:hypothetical protein